MADVHELGRLAAGIQDSDRELNATAFNLRPERALVEIADVLGTELFQQDENIAECAVQEFDGERFGCRDQS